MPLFTFEKPPEERELDGLMVGLGIIFLLVILVAWPYGFLCVPACITAWVLAVRDWLPE